MTRYVQKVKKTTAFRKCEYVYKASQTHKSKYTPARFRSEKTINMVSVSSHIDLKNRVSDFWHVRLLFFYKRIKFEKGKNRTSREKKA